MKPLKVIDLFAGPGGLGEGFSAYLTPDGEQAFRIALSIEKEASAHRTLLLRALFRQYPYGDAPEAYYAFLRGELGATPEEQLYKLPELQDALAAARREAQAIELGVTDKNEVDQKVREALGGEDFVLIGGPPCQAYSLVGRARNTGDKSRIYDPDEDHRNFLYREYLEIIAKFQPSVFVMENVKGMLSAKTSEGPVFPRIREDLADPCKSSGLAPDQGRASSTYKILSFVVKAQGDLLGLVDDENLDARDFVIRAEEFGIPQARHRVILFGIRGDVSGDTVETLAPRGEKATVKNAIGDLPKLRSGISKGADELDVWTQVPAKTAERLGDYKSQIPENVIKALFDSSRKINPPTSRGTEFGQKTAYEGMTERFKDWFIDPRMNGYITNHSTRGHIIEDLARYWFASSYRAIEKRSPKALDFPKPLWPAHVNFTSGKFADRFRVQGFDLPASTVTSHISKDGHYFIHPDPRQMRSLTVREAARIQTFPDNYHFVGSRTEQYVQVGNAVPPLLASQLAAIVISTLK
ncbi:DNA cytosine methyltransferase [Luminiphilus sp.]|nr:DNA cytosine methyltransferase [Luminiphilus sp.]